MKHKEIILNFNLDFEITSQDYDLLYEYTIEVNSEFDVELFYKLLEK